MITGAEINFVVKDSLLAIDEYQEIFEDIEVVEQTDFETGSNEVVFNLYGTRFHMLDENPEYHLLAPVDGQEKTMWLNIAVPDIKRTYSLAIEKGGTEILPVTFMEEMGVSNAMFSDKSGYLWMLHEIHEEVSFEDRVGFLSKEFD